MSLTILLVGLASACGAFWLHAQQETTPPPEGLVFDLSEDNPVTSFELKEGQYKKALENDWKVVFANSGSKLKWTVPYNNKLISITPNALTKGAYCSYLISPALKLDELGGSVLSFLLSADKGANNGGDPLPFKILLIDKTGKGTHTFDVVPQSTGGNDYKAERVSMPSDLKGIGFIAFVAKGDAPKVRRQFKLQDIVLAKESSEPSITYTPAGGLSWDAINVGEQGYTKEVELFVVNHSEKPVISIEGADKEDFLIMDQSSLTSAGGKVGIAFAPKTAGSNKMATLKVVAGTASIEIALKGAANGTTPPPTPQPEPGSEPKENTELLKDQFFYEFDAAGRPKDWEYEGNVSRLEGGVNSSTGAAIKIDARESDKGGAIFQKVALTQDKIAVRPGHVLEGSINFRSQEPKLADGVVRLACQWLNAEGQKISTDQDAFIHNDFYFDRHKAWDLVKFRAIVPEGATHFLFRVETKAGSMVQLDDFGLLWLNKSYAAEAFVSVLPHIMNVDAEVGKPFTGKFLTQLVKFGMDKEPSLTSPNGTFVLSPAKLTKGTRVQEVSYTLTPAAKGKFLNGYQARYNGLETTAAFAINANIIDPSNPPSIKLAEGEHTRTLAALPGEKDEHTINFEVANVIDHVTVKIEQEGTDHAFKLNTSQFYYSPSKDKVLNSSVKITFNPRHEGDYKAKLILSSPRMKTMELEIKGIGRKATDGWKEEFMADKEKDARFTGDAWIGYHLFDRGYYKLDGRWVEKGKISVDAKGSLTCDELFANGVTEVTVTPAASAAQMDLFYTIDGGAHWLKVPAATAEGRFVINSHRPTNFRLTNRSASAVELNKLSLSLPEASERISYETLSKEAFTFGAEQPLAIMNETFNNTRHTRSVMSNGWQNIATLADRPFKGWAQKDKKTGKIEEQCMQISFFNSLDLNDMRKHEAWLISPALSYKKAASKMLTFRLRYELPAQNPIENFGIYILTQKDGNPVAQYLDISKLLLVDKVDDEEWYDYFVDLSKAEGINIEDQFHVAFSFFSPTGGGTTSLVFMIDDVTFGRTDITKVKTDKDMLSFLFKPKVKTQPQGFNVTVENPSQPVKVTLVPKRQGEYFTYAPAELPANGGAVAVIFEAKETTDRAAALLLQTRGGISSLVRLLAKHDTAVESFEPLKQSKVYPTVTDGILYVDAAYEAYFIFSLEGTLMAKGEAKSQIDVSELPAGSYIIRVQTIDGGMASHRFVRR